MASLEVNPSFGAAALAAKTEAGRTAGWLNFRQTRDGKTNGQDHYRTTPIDPEHHTRVHGPPYDALPPCTTPHPTVQCKSLDKRKPCADGGRSLPALTRSRTRTRRTARAAPARTRSDAHLSRHFLTTTASSSNYPRSAPPHPNPPHPPRCQSKRVIYGSS